MNSPVSNCSPLQEQNNTSATIAGNGRLEPVSGPRSAVDAISPQDLILTDSFADLGLVADFVAQKVSPKQHLNPASDVTEKPTNAPTNVPPTRQRVELPAASIGFTLKSDDETIRDIEKIQETAIKAAQEVKKFALK